MKPTVDQIKAMARHAAFYSNDEGSMRRMMCCEEDHFVVEDEDEGLFFQIQYDEVTLTGFEAFYKLEQMTVPA